MRDEDVKKIFEKEVNREDVKKAVEKGEEILTKVRGGFLSREFAKIKLLVMMVKDYWNEIYTEVPWHSITAIVITLLYILSPIDLIPDFILVVGQVDDLLVLLFAWQLIQEDVRKYAKWKIKNGFTEVQYLYDEAFGA